MSNLLNEGQYTAEFLLSEGNGSYSRDVVTIPANTPDIAPGTPLAKTADGHYVPVNDAASDGTQTAVAVLYAKSATSTADRKAVAIVRDAEVGRSYLVNCSDTDAANLTANGVIVR